MSHTIWAVSGAVCMQHPVSKPGMARSSRRIQRGFLAVPSRSMEGWTPQCFLYRESDPTQHTEEVIGYEL